MPVLRVVFAVFAFAFAQPALAVEFWPAADCEIYMTDHVEHLEEDIADIEDLLVRIAEADRKGEAESAATFRNTLHSKRVDGIQSLLKRIDTVEYVYCDKALLDPSLIARVDAARPYGEETETVVAEVEEAVDLQVAGVTSTFVPYETIETGGCRGPFLDLAVTIANQGGTFPRAVDLEKREREYPGANMPYFTVNLEFDWNNGVTGGQETIVVGKDMLSGGTLAKGGAITLPLRVRVGNNQTAVTVKPMIMAGSFLQISGDKLQTDRVPFSFDVPMWDIYTRSVGVVTGPDRDNKRIINATIKAEIVNLGTSPIPGWVAGSFSVRQVPNGPRLAVVSGLSYRPIPSGGDVLGQSTTAGIIKGKTFVDSAITLLCPDGTGGELSDGNVENNTRVLQGEG
jgi:hypothetical protein